jgi:micrococcal nuclease
MFDEYRAKLHRVIDGDTFELDIDLGFGCWTRQVIRLRGLDTPELRTPEGKIAKEAAVAWFRRAEALTLGGWIMIRPQQTSHGDFVRTFIRYVAEIREYEGSGSLADTLRAAGHVK